MTAGLFCDTGRPRTWTPTPRLAWSQCPSGRVSSSNTRICLRRGASCDAAGGATPAGSPAGGEKFLHSVKAPASPAHPRLRAGAGARPRRDNSAMAKQEKRPQPKPGPSNDRSAPHLLQGALRQLDRHGDRLSTPQGAVDGVLVTLTGLPQPHDVVVLVQDVLNLVSLEP